MNGIIERNNVKIIGDGKKTIVFGHGFANDQNIWQFITPYFQENYRIVLFDYVGSGHSDLTAYNPERYRNYGGYVLDVLEILEALQTKSVIFIGHSASAMIGLLASIQKPELFGALVMIGPSPRYLNDLPNYFGGFDEKDIRELLGMMEMNFIGCATLNASALMNNPERPELANKLRDAYKVENPAIMRNFAEVIFLSDYRSELSKVTVPTLIMQCSQDSIVPIEVGNYLHQHIKNSSLEIMKAKGHYPQLSQPAETKELIARFIESL